MLEHYPVVDPVFVIVDIVAVELVVILVVAVVAPAEKLQTG